MVRWPPHMVFWPFSWDLELTTACGSYNLFCNFKLSWVVYVKARNQSIQKKVLGVSTERRKNIYIYIFTNIPFKTYCLPLLNKQTLVTLSPQSSYNLKIFFIVWLLEMLQQYKVLAYKYVNMPSCVVSSGRLLHLVSYI